MPEDTSASLLARVQRADPAAWARFADLYAPLVELWAGRLGVPPQDRPDVVQAVFATLLTALPGFAHDPAKRFRGYLFAVTRSRVADYWRAGRGVPLAAEPLAPDPTEDVIAADYHRHLKAMTDRILATDFTLVTAAAFRRYAVGGEPADTVAADLGVSVDVVYQAKARVSRRLRQELAGLLD